MAGPKQSDLRDEEIVKLLRELQESPYVTQRELSSKLEISLGKINYIIKALISKGIVKAKVFKKSNNKQAYFYILTPQGLEEKAKATHRFLKSRIREYDDLKREIDRLKKEVDE